MNPPTIDQLRDEVHRLREQLRQLDGLPAELKRVTERLKDLESQLAQAVQNQTTLNLKLDTINESVLTLVNVVKGDSAYKRKGLVDEIDTLKAERAEYLAFKNKGLGIIAFIVVVLLPFLVWVSKTFDILLPPKAK